MPAPFLAQVEQDAAAGFADDLQRFLELRPAIAFQRAEHVAGQAFAVQADQRRLAAERADHQRDMLLPVVRSAEGDDLRRAAGRRAAASRAATISTSGCRSSRAIVFGETTIAAASVVDQPQRRQQPRRARKRRAPLSRVSAQSSGNRMERPDRPAVEVLARDRRAPSAVSASSHSARSISTGCAGSAASRSLASDERRRPLAADQQAALPLGIEQVEQFRRRGLDRHDRDRLSALDPHRPPGAKRGDRPRGSARVRSNLDLADQRHMVRRPLPVAARLEHLVRA